MKKLLITFSVAIFLFSCGNKNKLQGIVNENHLSLDNTFHTHSDWVPNGDSEINYDRKLSIERFTKAIDIRNHNIPILQNQNTKLTTKLADFLIAENKLLLIKSNIGNDVIKSREFGEEGNLNFDSMRKYEFDLLLNCQKYLTGYEVILEKEKEISVLFKENNIDFIATYEKEKVITNQIITQNIVLARISCSLCDNMIKKEKIRKAKRSAPHYYMISTYVNG